MHRLSATCQASSAGVPSQSFGDWLLVLVCLGSWGRVCPKIVEPEEKTTSLGKCE